MARRSLRPQLNQIRAWVRQGRTDAWIAHQLEATVQQIGAFKRENGLTSDADGDAPAAPGADFDDEIDLRAEDDALIAAELEQAQREREEREQREREERERERAAREASGDDAEDEDEDDDEERDERPARRRGRRGGRRRKAAPETFEGTFDHGEEGYGLWLDPAVQDDPVYAEHWAGHRPIEITIEEEQIVIRRSGGDDED